MITEISKKRPAPDEQMQPQQQQQDENHQEEQISDDQLQQQRRKSTHLEQKRRQTLRDKFRELSDLVPGLREQSLKSEAVILQKTVEYMNFLIEQQVRLQEELKRYEDYR